LLEKQNIFVHFLYCPTIHFKIPLNFIFTIL